MSAEIHTINQSTKDVKWRPLIVSDPPRAVRALQLAFHPQRTTREGDDLKDAYDVLNLAVEIAQPLADNQRNEIWDPLVDAGIVDVLCKYVTKMVTLRKQFPEASDESNERVRKIPPAYVGALDTLHLATYHFQSPPNKADKRVIQTLRKNWSNMMSGLWNQPERTLLQEDQNAIERAAVARIVARIIPIDPTFLSIMYQHSDLTIAVLSRLWKHASHELDTSYCVGLLHSFFSPTHPSHIKYNQSHPPPYTYLISQLSLGVGPSPPSVEASAKALISVFANQLPRVASNTAKVELSLLSDILIHSEKADTIVLMGALLKSTPFWNSAFRLLKKAAKKPDSSEDGSYTEQVRLAIMADIVTTAGNVLHHTSLENEKECETLVRIWANENFFGAVEESIEGLLTIPGMAMQLSRIASIMCTTVAGAPPPLIRLLGTQFPRWRLIGAIIKLDVQRQSQEGPPTIEKEVKLPPPDSNVWNHGAWQCLASLQGLCFDTGKTCSKRGCGKDGLVHCGMCLSVLYCGDGCRTKDQKDHKICCSSMELIKLAESQGKPQLSTSYAATLDSTITQLDAAVLEDVD